MQEPKTVWVEQFQGLNDSVSPGANPKLTDILQNVKVQHGQVRPRGGLSPFQCVGYLGNSDAVAASADIIGLWSYQIANDLNPDCVVRMLPSRLEVSTFNACWTNVSGTTPLDGTTLTRPQAVTMDDVFVAVNEGYNRPVKFEGDPLVDSALIASGTAPFAKCIASYIGFLMLGNISDTGMYGDVFDGYRMIRYSDDWDSDWAGCAGNEIILVETPGSLLAMGVLGQDLMCCKTDGVVRVHWTGGQVRFTQKKLDFAGGMLAPLSLASLADQALCFLGIDAVLYLITPDGQVQNISYDALYNRLPVTINLAKLRYARSMIDDDESTYYLFYDRTLLANQLLDSYVSYNWRSKEFCFGVMGKALNAFTQHRASTGAPRKLLAASPTLVYEFGEALTDDGVKIQSFTTTGWQNMGEEGWMVGIRLIFKKPFRAIAYVKVSIAQDLEESFDYNETITLKGYSTADRFVEVSYKPPALYSKWFNLRIDFHRTAISSQVELRRVGFELSPSKPTITSDNNIGAVNHA